MADNESKTTTDHDEIRRWAEERGGKPATVKGTESGGEDADTPFPVETAVEHTEWGNGVVMRVEDDRLVVLFDEVGYKTLALAAVTENDLLRVRG